MYITGPNTLPALCCTLRMFICAVCVIVGDYFVDCDTYVSIADDGGGGRARQRGGSSDCQHREGGLALQTR
jgi:hypothetical protein